MDSNDLATPVVILLALLLFIAVAYGWDWSSREIAKSCDRLGEFTADGATYKCELVEVTQ